MPDTPRRFTDQLRVGELYDPRQTYWPFEGPQWHLSTVPYSQVPRQVAPDTVLLMSVFAKAIIFLHSPSDAEVAVFENSVSAKFALTPGEHCLLLSHQFAHGNWADGSWQAVVQQDGPPGVPDGPGHMLVWMLLVDADTGVLRAQKVTSWPPEFVTAVRDAIATQLRNAAAVGSPEAAKAAGETEIRQFMATYPTPEAIVGKAAAIVVHGGRDSRIIRGG